MVSFHTYDHTEVVWRRYAGGRGTKCKRKPKGKENVVRARAPEVHKVATQDSRTGRLALSLPVGPAGQLGLATEGSPGAPSVRPQTLWAPAVGSPSPLPIASSRSSLAESACGAFVPEKENSLVSSVFNFQCSFDSSVSTICDKKRGRMGTITQYFPKHGMQAKMYIINLFLVCRKNTGNLFMTKDTAFPFMATI